MKTSIFLTKLIFLALIILAGASKCNSQTKDSTENKNCIEKIRELYGQDVDYSGPFAVSKVEKESKVTIEKDGKKVTLSFGFQNEKWKAIKSKMKKGDKIFKFTTNPDSWANLAGREGYIVLRGSEVVGTIITMMN